MNMNCLKCRFFVDHKSYIGECRRNSPKMSDESIYGVWPSVTIDGWCGEWSPNEEWRRRFDPEVMGIKE